MRTRSNSLRCNIVLSLKLTCAIVLATLSGNRVVGGGLLKGDRMLDTVLAHRYIHVLPEYVDAVLVVGDLPYSPPALPEPIDYRDGHPLYRPDSSKVRVTFESEATRSNISLFEAQPQLLEACRTTDIALSLAAFSLNGTPFEIPSVTGSASCQIVVFKTRISQSVYDIFRDAPAWGRFKILSVAAAGQMTVPPGTRPPMAKPAAGFHAQHAKQFYYYAIASDCVIIASTSEHLLRDVLGKVACAGVPDNGIRTPPDSLRKSVTMWGFCRLTRRPQAKSTHVLSRIDPAATAIQVEFDSASRSLTVRLESGGLRPADALTKVFDQLLETPVTAQSIGNGVAVASMSNLDGTYWIRVVALLGMLAFV